MHQQLKVKITNNKKTRVSLSLHFNLLSRLACRNTGSLAWSAHRKWHCMAPAIARTLESCRCDLKSSKHKSVLANRSRRANRSADVSERDSTIRFDNWKTVVTNQEAGLRSRKEASGCCTGGTFAFSSSHSRCCSKKNPTGPKITMTTADCGLICIFKKISQLWILYCILQCVPPGSFWMAKSILWVQRHDGWWHYCVNSMDPLIQNSDFIECRHLAMEHL